MSSDDPVALTQQVQEIITEELELFTTLVVTDHAPLEKRTIEMSLDVRLAVMPSLEHSITVVDKLALHAARAGKQIRTWCTATDSGRRIATEVARALNPAMREGKVLHISVPPDHWQPAIHPFDYLVDGARPTVPARADRAETAEQPLFDTSPAEVARRLILRSGENLLVVAPPLLQSYQGFASTLRNQTVYSTGYALDDNGVWRADGDPWARWLIEIAEDMIRELGPAGLRGKALSAAAAAIDRIKRPSMVDQVRPMLRAALDLLRRDGEPCHDVTECAAEDLDARQRYLGTISGVVDLATGSLLPPEKGRKAWVTVMAPTKFDPAARHHIVDDLLNRMSPERRRHFMGALGNGVRAKPKRLYAVVCEPDCGKTTYHNLIVNTLGPVYAKTAGTNVLQDRRKAMTSDTQLTPGLTAWWAPTRIVIMDEVKESNLSPELVKDLTGGGMLTARGIRQGLQTKPVTGTTFMLSNEETVPQLRLDDSGLRARYRELRLPHIPDDERDEGHIRDEAAQFEEVRTAFLAALVAAAKENPEPPEDTPEVKANTIKRIEQDAGEFGRLARRLVRDGDARLSFSDMWVAWCQANSEPTEAKAPGGIGKRTIVRRLRAYHRDLPDPTTIRIDNRNTRGWRGWRMLTVEEMEQAAAAEQQAEETEPNYAPSPEAEQAIRNLADGFPDALSVLGVTLTREDLIECLCGVGSDEQLLALRDDYKNGRKLAEKLQEMTKVIFFGSDKPIEPPDWIKQARAAAEKPAAGWLDNTIHLLAWLADRNRPFSSACQQALDRFNSMDMISRIDHIAIAALCDADRELRGASSAMELLLKAVDIVVDSLSFLSHKATDLVSPVDIEAAMKKLLGLEDRVSAAVNRSALAPPDNLGLDPDGESDAEAAIRAELEAPYLV